MPNLHDTGETIPIPNQCHLEPVAIYYDRNDKVDIDRSIWEAWDSQSKAALVTHELIYNYLRGLSLNPSTNSEEARVLTASWFSTNLTPVNSGVPTSAERRVFFAKIVDNGHGGMRPIRTINAISCSVPSYPPPRQAPFWPKILTLNIMFHQK